MQLLTGSKTGISGPVLLCAEIIYQGLILMKAPVSMAKMNGSGNAIIIADMRSRNDSITPEIVRQLAKIREIGFDQIMVIHDSQHTDADYSIEIWNRDGSKARACGNGMRCVTEWLYRKEYHNYFVFDTMSGFVYAQRLQNGFVSVDMGKPHFNWQEIPLIKTVEDIDHVALRCGPLNDASVLSIGNPHAIFFVKDNVAGYKLLEYGPRLEHNLLFPEQANISVAQVTSETSLDLRTWERGAGLTRACGTAACASVIAACRRGMTKNEVQVTQPGGILSVRWEKNGHVKLIGATEYEFSALLDIESKTLTRNLM
ncbi:MAG: diaminopimelate epimerase [Candidatus Tokpelaia sp. JSC188]|nr:MAG: diaminopimelate epimerase [Candidatus Tokpelaia sp. JSC188]